jgi:hypothetical protein
MRHAPTFVTELIPLPPLAKRGIFVLVFDALYHSRRRRVERTLWRYRDVISQAQLAVLRELNGRCETREHGHE